METGYPEAVATLVVFGDGITSLCFSNGGGIIGHGRHVLLPLFHSAHAVITAVRESTPR